MVQYYNSIQDGACCKTCFVQMVESARDDGTLLAVSEEFRFGAAQVVSRIRDYADGVEDPFDISDGYVDRAILKVTDEEIIIVTNDADPRRCLGWGNSKHN